MLSEDLADIRTRTDGMGADAAYTWFINEWLPEKGDDHMRAFLQCEFSPLRYFAWRLMNETPKPHLRDALSGALGITPAGRAALQDTEE